MKTGDYKAAEERLTPEEMRLRELLGEEFERLEREEMAVTVENKPSSFKAEALEDLCIRTIPESVCYVADGQTTEHKEPKNAKKGGNIHAGHRERVRKRYIDEGLSGFKKHEVLELLLFYAIQRADTNELAHRLLNAYNGNLSEIMGADVKSLSSIPGIGDNAAVFLTMIPQVFKIYREELMRREGISGREKVEEYIANRFTGERVERVLIACLDYKMNLIGCEFTDTGSVNFSSVNLRNIIDACLRYNATMAIIAHNHPRGTALPSKEDLTTTLRVKQALDIVGVRLIDHMIVAGEDYISLACSKRFSELF